MNAKSYQGFLTSVDKHKIELDLIFFLLSVATAFLLSLKLSVTYLFVTPMLLLVVLRYRLAFVKELSLRSPIGMFLAFCAVTWSCSAFGFDLMRSSRKLTTFAFSGLLMFSTIIFLQRYSAKALWVPLAAGQIVTTSFSIITKILLGYTPEVFHGEVTQSGQLAILVPLFLGLLGQHIVLDNRKLVRSAVTTISLSFAALIGHWLKWLALVAGGVSSFRSQLPMILLSLCGATLLTNLKRGPWLGVAVGLLIILLKLRPRIIPVLVTITLVCVFAIAPVRSRVLQAKEHFFIAGGRSIMWHIGQELASRYPLGIGFGNSRILREFSQEIPFQHRHFHNNALNLVVEGGWISATLFFYWIINIIGRLLRGSLRCTAIAASLISWQVAGICEYNIGDSEITMLAFIVIGAGIYFLRSEAPSIEAAVPHRT